MLLQMMRLLAVMVVFFELCSLPDVSCFLPAAPQSKINECRLAVDDDNYNVVADNCSPPPPHPVDDIEPESLLSQAYSSLTVKELRDLLRKKGAKVREF